MLQECQRCTRQQASEIAGDTVMSLPPLQSLETCQQRCMSPFWALVIASQVTVHRFSPSCTMVSMGVFAATECAYDMHRPCVDCGRRTGNFCDADCCAAGWCPSEQWCEGQITPHCNACEKLHGVCHYCRDVQSCTPPSWGGAPRCDCDRCKAANPNEPITKTG